MALTTITLIFERTYHERTSIAGLHFIALGIGITICSQLNGRYTDRLYVHLKETRGGGVGEPEFRLRESRAMPRIGDKILKYFLHHSFNGSRDDFAPYWPSSSRMGSSAACVMGRYRRRECIPGCVILFIELIRLQCDEQGIALIGGGMILIFQSIQTYVVDAFTLHAASGMHPYLHSYVLLNIYPLLRSTRGSSIPPFPCRLRLPALRACYVQFSRVR